MQQLRRTTTLLSLVTLIVLASPTGSQAHGLDRGAVKEADDEVLTATDIETVVTNGLARLIANLRHLDPLALDQCQLEKHELSEFQRGQREKLHDVVQSSAEEVTPRYTKDSPPIIRNKGDDFYIAQQRIYELLEMVPWGDAYFFKTAWRELLTQNAVAYYDEESDTTHMAEREISVAELLDLRHELTGLLSHEHIHALQDHQFEIKQFPFYSDQNLAYRAVLEGDAELVEELLPYTAAADGEPDSSTFFDSWSQERIEQEIVKPHLEAVLRQLAAAEVSPEIPAFLQQRLRFPYLAGIGFVTSLLQPEADNPWQLVNQAIRDNPPNSTEQVLHPEKYAMGNVEDENYDAPVEIPRGFIGDMVDDAYVESSNVAGEYELGLRLAYKLQPDGARSEAVEEAEAREAAAGWDGDREWLLYSEETGYVFVSLSVWDGPKGENAVNREAEEFVRVWEKRQQESTYANKVYQKGNRVLTVVGGGNINVVISFVEEWFKDHLLNAPLEFPPVSPR